MAILPTLLLNALLASSLYLLVGLGFYLSFSARGFFDLSYAVLIPVGGYLTFVLTRWMHAPLGFSVLVAILGAGFFASVLQATVFQVFQAKKTGGLTLLVVSLGLMSVLQSVLVLIFSSRFQILPVFEAPSFFVRGLSASGLTFIQLLTIVSSLGIFGLIVWVLRATHFGKTLRAIRDDREVARAIGMDVRRATSIAILIAGLLAGCIGMLVGMDVGIDPTMGLGLLLKGVTAALIGGMERVQGVLIGACLVGACEQLSVWVFPGAWKEAIVFLLLLIILKKRASVLRTIRS